MKSALLRLRESQDAMSTTERVVSDYLLTHQGDVMEMSIHQLAERTFASPSTVIRMCQRVGFAGYKEFRQAVTCEVAVRRMGRGQDRREITQSDSLDDIVDKVTDQNILSLEDSKSFIDTGTLQSCVDLLQGSRRVLLFGLGAALGAAEDLKLKLLRLNKPCVVSDGWYAQLHQAEDTGENDLAVVASCSGETAEIVKCMKALRENGTPIIAIALREDSSVAALSDYQLYTADSKAAAHSAAMSSCISQLNMIDILFTAYANREYEYRPDQRPGTHLLESALAVPSA